MTLAALSENPVHTTLWDLDAEAKMGHIQLHGKPISWWSARRPPISWRMSAGIADDLAATLLLATDKPVLAVPAMNVRMWQHAATRRNVATLRSDGVDGRSRTKARWPAASSAQAACPNLRPFSPANREAGRYRQTARRKACAGHRWPSAQPIDPVRYIANRSSGRQGFAIAEAAARAGARVTLVAGPVALPTPPGVTRVDVQTAREIGSEQVDARRYPPMPAIMGRRSRRSARGGQRPKQKRKKDGSGEITPLTLTEKPGHSRSPCPCPNRPRLLGSARPSA